MVDKIKVENLNCFYSGKQVLKNLSLTVKKNEILSIIGPSNSGKTSFLRTLNRMNDMNVSFSRKGDVFLDDENIFEMNPEKLRTRIGMLFAMPIPLPMSILLASCKLSNPNFAVAKVSREAIGKFSIQ